ncbi:MAG: peptidoglycan DD-metalloendopeptidase family protein [Clostridiales bacterium]|nr:peptidoglycan DD-metalloendopeptidase family protein [Clostridiales bacterium]
MEKVFLAILNMSLTASFVIVAIMLARLPLKKAPKIISYALWAVVGFRLMFPFTLESVFSLLPFKAELIPPDIALQAVPRINSGITIIDDTVSALLPAATSAASVNPLQIWFGAISCVWLFGIGFILIYSLVSIILLKRRLRGAVLVWGNIYEAEAAKLKTPFVIGFFRPRIYIPAGLLSDERRYIILHEQTHIRRYDHVVKMLAFLVLCLHWFNPFVWAAFILMSADMEMSCDERVMKELGADIKNDYSMSLVRVAAGRKILNGCPLAFGEGGMKQRIKNVLNFKKPPRIIIVAAVVLAIVITVGFAVSKISDSANNDIPDITATTLPETIDQPKEFTTNTGDSGSSSILAWPYLGDGVSSYFGYRASGFHIGLDISGSVGDAVAAAADGEVILSGWYDDLYGNLIVIAHPDGMETWYGHLSDFAVNAGDKMTQGQVIGAVGDTGKTTGPHLHFEVHIDDVPLDPLLFLDFNNY